MFYDFIDMGHLDGEDGVNYRSMKKQISKVSQE